MTALSIGLGIGPCIPVILGDIAVVQPDPPPVLPPPVLPPPELNLAGGGTIEITVSDGDVTVTVGDTGLYDGSHAFHTRDLSDGPVAIVPPVLSGGTEPGAVLTARPALLVHPTGRVPEIGRRWLRDGVAIAEATEVSYTVVVADRGKSLAVAETATNADGARVSTSTALAIPAAAQISPANLLAFNDPSLPGFSKPASVTIDGGGGIVVARDGTNIFVERHIDGALNGIAKIEMTATSTGPGRHAFAVRIADPAGGSVSVNFDNGGPSSPARTVTLVRTLALPANLVKTTKAILLIYNYDPGTTLVIDPLVTKAATA